MNVTSRHIKCLWKQSTMIVRIRIKHTIKCVSKAATRHFIREELHAPRVFANLMVINFFGAVVQASNLCGIKVSCRLPNNGYPHREQISEAIYFIDTYICLRIKISRFIFCLFFFFLLQSYQGNCQSIFSYFWVINLTT